MHYAICYVSSANTTLSEDEIENLLNNSRKYNTSRDITGILLFSEGNFFQVLEGKKESVLPLFEKIKEDERHQSIIPIFKRPIERNSYDGYACDFISESIKLDEQKIHYYTSYLQTLDQKSRETAKSILKAFIS